MPSPQPASYAHRYLLPLAAFLAVLPLLVQGPSCGHDFDFHLLSWLEAATQYAHGGYPHWAFTPAFNAGEPRFLFYPPISWTLGALLTLLLPIQFAGTAFTFLALTLSGFTAHRLASRFTSPPSALLCATLYLANPYMLFTAYERTAFAELLAAAWLPLLFEAALTHPNIGCPMITAASSRLASRLLWAKSLNSRQILHIAFPIALLWLTNAPAAVMGCYALAILTLTQLLLPTHLGCHSRRESAFALSKPALTLTTLAGTTLGLLLPAFYLLPAAYERRYVQITLATISGMRPQDHFLFHRMPGLTPDDLFHNAVVRTASQVSLLLLAAIAITLGCPMMSAAFSRHRGRSPLASVAMKILPLTLLIAFLLTPPSLPLWNHTPQLAYLQFPWRLDALLAVILLILAGPFLSFCRHSVAKRRNLRLQSTWPFLSFCCHSVAKRRNLRLPSTWPAIASPILAAALILPAYAVFHQSCDETDTPTARAALFHSPTGTEPTDEYTPTTADNDALASSAPWFLRCLSTHPDLNMPSPMPAPGQAPRQLDWDVPCNALIVLNRRAYPDWRLTVNGVQPTLIPRDDGRLAFTQPRGPMSLRLRWQRPWDQTLGLALSALAAILALLLWTFGRTPD